MISKAHLKDVRVFDFDADCKEFLVRLYGDNHPDMGGVSWVDFAIYEVAFLERGESRFFHKDGVGIAQNTANPDDAVVVVDGHVKWDGCTEFQVHSHHVCNAGGISELFHAIKVARFEAARLMGPAAQTEIVAEYFDAEGTRRPDAVGL